MIAHSFNDSSTSIVYSFSYIESAVSVADSDVAESGFSFVVVIFGSNSCSDVESLSSVLKVSFFGVSPIFEWHIKQLGELINDCSFGFCSGIFGRVYDSLSFPWYGVEGKQ